MPLIQLAFAKMAKLDEMFKFPCLQSTARSRKHLCANARADNVTPRCHVGFAFDRVQVKLIKPSQFDCRWCQDRASSSFRMATMRYKFTPSSGEDVLVLRDMMLEMDEPEQAIEMMIVGYCAQYQFNPQLRLRKA